MLKPFICVVCEKVIISNDDVASLIRLFNKITVFVPDGQEPPPSNGVVPKEWSIFAGWEYVPEDVGEEFLVCTDIHYPDGTPFGAVSKSKINLEEGKQRAHIVQQFQIFPVGQLGDVSIGVWLEHNNEIVGDRSEMKISLELSQTTVEVK